MRRDLDLVLVVGGPAVAVHTGIGHTKSSVDLLDEQRPHLDLADVGVLARPLTRERASATNDPKAGWR
jgi:4-nitrophenyl phosphatase